MSNNTIENSFVIEFGKEVHTVFQDQGQKLANTVRTVRGVKAKEYVFQIYGKGEATDKSRHSNVPYMNVDHNTVTCYLKSKYAAEPVDDIDMLQQNYDEKRQLAKTCAVALGRAADKMILDVAYETPYIIGSKYDGTSDDGFTDTGFTLEKTKGLRAHFSRNFIFDGGGRNFVFVTADAFNDLLSIDGFSRSNYIDDKDKPFKLAQLEGKRWMGFDWYTWDSLGGTSTMDYNIAFNENCIGHCIGLPPTTLVERLPKEDGWQVMSKMFMGAALIDSIGVVKIVTLKSSKALTAE
jgi:hypothetical protein